MRYIEKKNLDINKNLLLGKENGVDTKEHKNYESDEDDLMLIEYDEEDPQEGSSSKKRKINPPEDRVDEDDDLCVIED